MSRPSIQTQALRTLPTLRSSPGVFEFPPLASMALVLRRCFVGAGTESLGETWVISPLYHNASYYVKHGIYIHRGYKHKYGYITIISPWVLYIYIMGTWVYHDYIPHYIPIMGMIIWRYNGDDYINTRDIMGMIIFPLYTVPIIIICPFYPHSIPIVFP